MVTATTPLPHSWFVLVRDEDKVRDMAVMIIKELRIAQQAGKLLRVRVQEVDEEDIPALEK